MELEENKRTKEEESRKRTWNWVWKQSKEDLRVEEEAQRHQISRGKDKTMGYLGSQVKQAHQGEEMIT